MVDLPGMGLNSREKWIKKINSFEGYIDYFVTSLNSFFVKMNLNKFYLAGHSIGAYICTYYFDKHSEKIIQMYLLSPAGINLADEKF